MPDRSRTAVGTRDHHRPYAPHLATDTPLGSAVTDYIEDRISRLEAQNVVVLSKLEAIQAKLDANTTPRPLLSGPGLDHYQVRRYHAWYRHITLSMLAAAFLAVTAHTERDSPKGAPHPAVTS